MKKLLKLALAGALAILPSAVAHAQTDITWWDFLSGGDGVRMKALIKEFNDTHPDIRINATPSDHPSQATAGRQKCALSPSPKRQGNDPPSTDGLSIRVSSPSSRPAMFM